MKKMILMTVIGLLVVALGIGGYSAQKLQHIHLQKRVHIKANLETVFEQVAYMKNFPSWSPFLEADPSQKITIKGTDGQVGVQYHWSGNEGKDLGYQEIKQMTPLKYIKMECNIQKPFTAYPTFEYSFHQEGSEVVVIQDFNLHSGLVDAFFMRVFGAQHDMDKMNARGMELLKKAAEGS